MLYEVKIQTATQMGIILERKVLRPAEAYCYDRGCFFNCEKFSRGSRSYLVVTVTVTSICYKWLQKLQLQQKVNMLQMGSKWDPNGIQMRSKCSNCNKKLPILGVT